MGMAPCPLLTTPMCLTSTCRLSIPQDSRQLPGAGASEIELAKRIAQFGEACPGLEQYAIKKFAEALEVVPRALAENAGLNPTEIVSKLYASHQVNTAVFKFTR